MTRSRTLGVMVGSAAMAFSRGVATAVAQDEAPAAPMDSMTDMTVAVSGVEYAFVGLPESVPVGSTLTFTNDGAEIHEIVVNRIADGVEETFEELLALSETVDLEAEGYIDTTFGDQMLLALSGQTAEGGITLEQEGRYVALCFIPTGLETAKLLEFGIDIETLGPQTDPADLPPEAQAYLEEVMTNGVPHMANGMIQEFTVVAEEAAA